MTRNFFLSILPGVLLSTQIKRSKIKKDFGPDAVVVYDLKNGNVFYNRSTGEVAGEITVDNTKWAVVVR